MCPIENVRFRYFLPSIFFPQLFEQTRTCIIKAHISYSNDITISLPTSNQLSMVLNVDLARTVVDSVLDMARNITCVALPVLLGLMQENPTIINDLRSVSDLFASQSSIRFIQQQVMRCRSTSGTTQAAALQIKKNLRPWIRNNLNIIEHVRRTHVTMMKIQNRHLSLRDLIRMMLLNAVLFPDSETSNHFLSSCRYLNIT